METNSCEINRAKKESEKSQAYHPLFVLRTCASCILMTLMAASVVYKGFCEYDNFNYRIVSVQKALKGFLNG